jgi:ATP-binding protein involved in chromosome partitioning
LDVPREIRKKKDGTGISLVWPDGHESVYTPAQLRSHCRCAACRNELTGERLLNPARVDPDLKIIKMETLGNYALGFLFSDGHGTGIYSFDTLREIS